MTDEPKTITLTPDYAFLVRQFGRDAILHMQTFLNSHGTVPYEDLYAFVASLRVALSSLDTTSDQCKLDFLEFRQDFDAVASRMFEHLDKLRDERETCEWCNNPKHQHTPEVWERHQREVLREAAREKHPTV